MQDSPGVFGVDVAKAEVVVAAAVERMPRKAICNERKALAAWLHTLPAGSIVAMESTGMHHRLLAELAHAAGMRVYVLNARDVYFYARALGARSKTDRVDAAIIARYAAEHHARLHAWQPAAGVYEQAMQLLRRRARVVVARERLRQTLAEVPGWARRSSSWSSPSSASWPRSTSSSMRWCKASCGSSRQPCCCARSRASGRWARSCWRRCLRRTSSTTPMRWWHTAGWTHELATRAASAGKGGCPKRGPGWLRRQLCRLQRQPQQGAGAAVQSTQGQRFCLDDRSHGCLGQLCMLLPEVSAHTQSE